MRGPRSRDDGTYEIAVGTVEFGEGTSTAHVQIAATVLGTTPSRVHLVQSDTDRTGFDTGAFASAGLFVSGNAVFSGPRPHCATASCASPPGTPASMWPRARWTTTGCDCGDVRVTLTEGITAAQDRGIRFTESRKAYGSPRSVTSNTHGFRIAVHRVTGEIRILYSVQATDARVVINPAQVRGQIEGGVAQGIGFVLTENFHVDEDGVMINPNLRNYRIPTYADVPRTEVSSSNRGTPSARWAPRESRSLHQPGRTGAGERTAGRDRRALPGVAADARADLRAHLVTPD